MPIGSDVVGGMMELFDQVMSVPGTSQIKKNAWKVFDPEDVEFLKSAPEAQQTHTNFNWMNKVLDKHLGEAIQAKGGAPLTAPQFGIGPTPQAPSIPLPKTGPVPPKAKPKSNYDPQITSTFGQTEGMYGPKVDPNLKPEEQPARRAASPYKTEVYRGISRPEKTQSPTSPPGYGIYSAVSNPPRKPSALAELYATEFHSGTSGNPQIMPLLLDTSNYMVVDAAGKSWAEVNSSAIKKAEAKGLKGVVIKNVWDEPASTKKLGAPASVYIILDPGTARSKFASFDPKKYGMNDLLASNRGFVVPPNLADKLQPTGGIPKASPLEKIDPKTGLASDQPFTAETLPATARSFAREFPKAPLIKTAIGTYHGLSQANPIEELKDLVSNVVGGGSETAKTFIESGTPGHSLEEQVRASFWAAQLAMTGGGGAAALGMTEKGIGANMPGFLQKWKGMVTPSKELIRATSDDLFRLKNWTTADKAELAQHLDQMPPEFKTAEMQEKFYKKLERPELQLSPGEQAAFNQYIEPMRKEIQKLFQYAGKFKVPLEDNEWVHRVMKGREGELPVDASGAADIPQLGTRKLPRKTSAMMPRSLYVLEGENGMRATVSQPKPGFLTIWNKGQHSTIKWGDDLEPGNVAMINGKKFVVKQAKTEELETNTPFRFQKSAAVNLGDSLIKMRSVVRNIEYLDRLTKSPDWLNWATKNLKTAPRDWVKPKIPQLDEWRVHPKLAAVLEDFYHPGFDVNALESLRNINRWSVGTLFWNPIPHIENVAGHWAVGRGWDWLKPTGWHSLFTDGARAIKETITMGDDYKSLLKHGSALISGGVQNADFYRVLAKKFGLEVQRNQSTWDKIARTVYLGGANDLVKAWYAGVNKILWQANDVFMMQRVFELERRGMTRLQAIRDAEKHIPNYRIPPEVLGSRLFSQVMQEPAITAFGRYHYGVWNSYANMVRDALGTKSTPKERFEAVGNMFALAGLVFGVYPAVSFGLQKLTGNQDIQKLPRGPAAIPTIAWQSIGQDTRQKMVPDFIPEAIKKNLTQGERQWYDIIGNSLTIAPPAKEILEQYSNRDFFTGRNIEEPGEPSRIRRGAQRAEHAAQSLVAPYGTARDIATAGSERGAAREVLKQAIGTQDPTERQLKGRRTGKKIEKQQMKSRRKKPRGFIEQLGGYLD